MLVACYVINYMLFRVFFNYEFMKGAPVYVPAQDPHGMFNAWNVRGVLYHGHRRHVPVVVLRPVALHEVSQPDEAAGARHRVDHRGARDRLVPRITSAWT